MGRRSDEGSAIEYDSICNLSKEVWRAAQRHNQSSRRRMGVRWREIRQNTLTVRVLSEGRSHITQGCKRLSRDDAQGGQWLWRSEEKAHPTPRAVKRTARSTTWKSSNLVDPASNDTLVSKIKPCMSKYKKNTSKLRTAH